MPVPPTSKLSFAYVDNDYSNSISMFTVGGDGVWTPTSPATIPVGNHPESLAVHPSGRFVYVPSIADNLISMFSVDQTTGLLTPLSPATVATGREPQFIAMDPLGRFAYTSDTNDNAVSMYKVDLQTGVLLPTSPATVSTGSSLSAEAPGGLTVEPKGRFVYASNQAGSVSSFALDPTTGVLTAASPAMVPAGNRPFTANADPGGRFLYVPDAGSDRLYVFAIDQTTGALTPAPVPSVVTGMRPTSVGIDPTGRYLWVVNRGDETISQFRRNAQDGSLTPMTPALLSSPGEPWQMLVDPSGQLVYVSQESANMVSIFSVGSDGTLQKYGSAPTGSLPGGIGVVPSP